MKKYPKSMEVGQAGGGVESSLDGKESIVMIDVIQIQINKC